MKDYLPIFVLSLKIWCLYEHYLQSYTPGFIHCRVSNFMVKRFLQYKTKHVSVILIAQYSPYYLPLNVFTASKGSNLYILFIILQEN